METLAHSHGSIEDSFSRCGPAYVVVTAAKNEAKYIEALLRSVVSQTNLPRRWVIVSDDSRDSTVAIIKRYQQHYQFIDLVELQSGDARNFGSKARAINAGYARISDTHDYVAIQDADVSFEPAYYERILTKFAEDPKLGLAGGVLYDYRGDAFVRQKLSTDWSVSGPLQIFRRECWQTIGGYLPLPSGLDAAAEVMVRMRGWKVKTYSDVYALHHRQTGTQTRGICRLNFDQGVADRQLGYHPLFFFARAVRRFWGKPYVVGGTLMLAGYVWASIRRAERRVPDEFVRFLRREQVRRLINLMRSVRHLPIRNSR